MTTLSEIAPAFIEVAHRIVCCTMATVDPTGQPRTRILHPIWELHGDRLTGWIATSPRSPKAAHLEHEPRISLTYWDPSHDVATADCRTVWELDEASRRAGWDRFANGPEPVGYDPGIAGWTDPMDDGFGVVRLEPTRLRVMPGSLLLERDGQVLSWSS